MMKVKYEYCVSKRNLDIYGAQVTADIILKTN